MSENECFDITYHFELEEAEDISYKVSVNAESSEIVMSPETKSYDWTALDYNQCSHCPLKKEDSPDCPIAINLASLVEHFKETKSYWKTKVTIDTEERQFTKQTDIQTGLFSIFGLIMATSGCPYTLFLKPMARLHLPFSSVDETMARSVSMYLLRQYFEAQAGREPDWKLEKLGKHYEDISEVNSGILQRIESLGKGDSQYNAFAVLETFSQLLGMEISGDLEGIKYMFEGGV